MAASQSGVSVPEVLVKTSVDNDSKSEVDNWGDQITAWHILHGGKTDCLVCF